MATQDDVRRIALNLPGVVEDPDHFAFSVPVKGKQKGFAWVWNERVVPKKPKVPNPGVLAIMVPNLMAKEILMGSDEAVFVADPHYDGFPAVLVRLDAISMDLLEELIMEGWRCKATAELRAAIE